MRRALFLGGGGARGAYQVGVLKGISDIIKSKQLPVQILSSISVGSINASYLGLYADDFQRATNNLLKLWSSLSCDQIFRTSNISLMKSVIYNALSAIFHWRTNGSEYLLDTTPLHDLLNSRIDFSKLNQNIEQCVFSAFEVASTCYDLAKTVSFMKSILPAVSNWGENKPYVVTTNIESSHILASSAVPLFFPAIQINALYYGDGAVINSNPLRAAIKLGADAILIIGTKPIPILERARENPGVGYVTFAKILNTMFDALFLDNLDREIEIINKVNQSLELLPPQARKKTDWRKINLLYIRPSTDVVKLAANKENVLPFLLKYLINSFGTKEQSLDFLSLLLFEAPYCKELIDLGHHDAFQHKNEIENFFL